MFDELSQRFEEAVKSLRGQAAITETNVEGALKQVRRALLEADVSLPVVQDFVEEVRRKAAERIGPERFLVVYLSAPIDVCRLRDTDGHYALADEGVLTNFPGVSAPYEPPRASDLIVPTHQWPVARCVDAIVELLEQRGII